MPFGMRTRAPWGLLACRIGNCARPSCRGRGQTMAICRRIDPNLATELHPQTGAQVRSNMGTRTLPIA
eukprot:4733103-Lingulodinium_polyedra.AAC.1